MSDSMIGHNRAPLAEILPEETKAFTDRAVDLRRAAAAVIVADEESAGKATILVGMIKGHLADIEAARVTRKEPFLADCRTVDSHYANIANALVVKDGKGRPVSGALFDVSAALSRYLSHKKAIEDAARAKAAEEARRIREEAEAKEAEHAAEIARLTREREDAASRKAQAGRVAELDSAIRDTELQQSMERARVDTTIQRIEARTSEHTASIHSYGVTASQRTTFHAEIEDMKKALAHALKIEPDAIKEAVQAVYDRQCRAGVRTLPGAAVRAATSLMTRSVR